jgi:hypothetical protein
MIIEIKPLVPGRIEWTEDFDKDYVNIASELWSRADAVIFLTTAKDAHTYAHMATSPRQKWISGLRILFPFYFISSKHEAMHLMWFLLAHSVLSFICIAASCILVMLCINQSVTPFCHSTLLWPDCVHLASLNYRAVSSGGTKVLRWPPEASSSLYRSACFIQLQEWVIHASIRVSLRSNCRM